MNKPTLRIDKEERKERVSILDTIMGIVVLALWVIGTAGGLWFLGQ